MTIHPAWVGLSLVGHLGAKTFRALLARFGTPEHVLTADESSLRAITGIGPKISQQIRAVDVQQVEANLRRWQARGVCVLTWQDDAYPEPLRPLDDAPPTLFVRGEQPINRPIAIVGTRHPTESNRRYAQNLASTLVEKGWCIVSGLALGVDAAAHMGALALPAGRTLAVLGGGVLNIFPPEHTRLADVVLRQGALLSETNPEAPASAGQLVARNRLISGLSEALIVIQTEADGGAMYAARFARAQGRPVYALDIDAGGNRLLLETGAHPLRPDLSDLPF
jgi:DNA processing protein